MTSFFLQIRKKYMNHLIDVVIMYMNDAEININPDKWRDPWDTIEVGEVDGGLYTTRCRTEFLQPLDRVESGEVFQVLGSASIVRKICKDEIQ